MQGLGAELLKHGWVSARPPHLDLEHLLEAMRLLHVQSQLNLVLLELRELQRLLEICEFALLLRQCSIEFLYFCLKQGDVAVLGRKDSAAGFTLHGCDAGGRAGAALRGFGHEVRRLVAE